MTDDDSRRYRDWNGDEFTMDELRAKYDDDYTTLRMYQEERGDGDLTDDEFDEKYSFEEWLNSGIYTLIEDEEEDESGDNHGGS